MIDLDDIKARLAAPHAAGAYDITVRLADGRLCLAVRMRDWDGNTAQAAYAAVAHLLGHAPADLTALVAEVERLREHRESCTENLLKGYETGKAEERAAVVKWLREEAEAAAQTFTVQAGEWANRIDGLAGDIERGEHRREGDE